MSPDPADRLIQAVRAALRELSDASGGAVELPDSRIPNRTDR